MKKIKKLVSVLAAGTMLTSMSAFSANAADEAVIAQMQNTLDEMAVAQEEMSADALAIAKTQEMLAEIQSTNEIFYYPTFDEYSETSLSTTAHYLVAIPEQTITSTTGFYFYINDNITKHTPNSNDITIGTGYKGYASIASVSSSVYANSCKQIFVKLNVKGTPSGNTEFFKYKFVDSEALAQAIDYESDLNTGTSRVKIKPDTVLYPNVGDKFAMKCIYSLGDVNRDGQVTLDDSKAVMSYNVHTAEADPARGDDGYYDTIAFKLAADFNEDGEIDIRDVVAINQYVTSH